MMTHSTKRTDTIAGEEQVRASSPLEDYLSDAKARRLQSIGEEPSVADRAVRRLKRTSTLTRSLLTLSALIPVGIAFFAAKSFAERR